MFHYIIVWFSCIIIVLGNVMQHNYIAPLKFYGHHQKEKTRSSLFIEVKHSLAGLIIIRMDDHLDNFPVVYS